MNAVCCVAETHSVVLFQEIGSVLLSISSDLSDQDDPLSFGVLQKHLQTVDEVGAVKRISTDS